MSYYESEIGNWSFPVAGWMKSVKALYEADCEAHNKHWDVANIFYIESKDEKIKEYRENFWGILERAKLRVFGGAFSRPNTPDWFDSEIVFRLCSVDTNTHKDDRKRPKKPKKNERKAAVKRGFPNEVSFGGDWPELHVDIKSRHIRLSISEGNRAVDRWWSTPIGVKFAVILRTTKWTGDNGGYSIHRGEMDDENNYEPTYCNVRGGKKFMKEFRKRRGW